MKKFENRSKNFRSDEEIIARFKKSGNTAVLGAIFNRYAKLVFGLCLKYMKNPYDAEDETMSIFEKLIGDLQKHEIENFRAWFYTYSKNHCLMELRKKKPVIIEFDSRTNSGSEENSDCHSEESGNELEQKLGLVQSLMGILKNDQKICLREFYENDKTYREVSNITGLSLRQVKSHIQNGKRNLKIQFDKINNAKRI